MSSTMNNAGTIDANSISILRMTATQLKRARKRLGLSQRELADKLGVTGPAIAQWETETNPIPQIVAVAMRAIAAENPPAKPKGKR
jgi:DNA-binding transcriptional regulator YiaG